MVFLSEFFYKIEYTWSKDHIENWKRKECRSPSNNTIFVIICERDRWIEWDTVYLSSKKCSEISKNSRKKKCIHYCIQITKSILFLSVRLNKEYNYKTKNCSKKREKIFGWHKEKVEKFTNLSINEIHKNKFLFYPFRKYEKYTCREEKCESERYDWWEYWLSESFFPRESMEKNEKKKPCTGKYSAKCINGNAKKAYRGVHYQWKLSIKN